MGFNDPLNVGLRKKRNKISMVFFWVCFSLGQVVGSGTTRKYGIQEEKLV